MSRGLEREIVRHHGHAGTNDDARNGFRAKIPASRWVIRSVYLIAGRYNGNDVQRRFHIEVLYEDTLLGPLVACRARGTFLLRFTQTFSTVKGQTQPCYWQKTIDFKPKPSVYQLAPATRELPAFCQNLSLLLEEGPAYKETSTSKFDISFLPTNFLSRERRLRTSIV